MAKVDLVAGDPGELEPTSDVIDDPTVGSADDDEADRFGGVEQDYQGSKEPSTLAKKWQSIADKRDAKLKAAEAELEQLRTVSPIKQLLDQRPDLMTIIERELLAAGKPKEEPLTKPEPPRKPVGYDEAEAVTTPDSKSFKYRLEREEYLERLTDYQQKLNDRLAAEMQAKTREVEARMQAREQDVTLRAKLASKGIVGESADRFIDNFTQANKLSFDDLVKFHFLKEGKALPGERGNPAPREFEPAPLIKAPTFRDEAGKEIDPSKAFSHDLARGAGKGKNLFGT